MVLQKKYSKSQETAIASYNFVDIAEGTGVVKFYGASHKETTTEAFFMSTNVTYSENVISYFNLAVDANTKVIDQDFDITFNLPQRIKGKVRVILPLGGARASAGSASVYAVVRVRKWDGTTETEIANSQSQTQSVVNLGGNSQVENIEVDVSTIQHFKKGETLRITVEVWGTMSGTTASVGFGHDPKNRDDPAESAESPIFPTDIDTIMEVYIPFVLDL